MAAAKRYSKKREAILALIQGTEVHPSADWVYQQLKPHYPDLSLGTVYRNLTAFREEGAITSVGVVQGQERFDGNVSLHTHFICRTCGRVEDFHLLAPPEELTHQAAQQYGGRVERYQLTFEGVCTDCLEEEKKVVS